MGAWQPLPADLPPEVRHFVEQLRLLKDRTGLSLVALGARTAYSKSSWQRYLNASQPPPRQAVVALCRVAGVDAERFGVRWELAVRVWPRTAAPDPVPAPAWAPAVTGASGTKEPERDAAPESAPEHARGSPARTSTPRLLLYALMLALLVLALLLIAVIGAGTLS
ncbi:helix-turn-helix transcriptional regulator [Streptomyces sp. NPDC050704]|uniref:helix-turn-helix domain-containing protein n=1 Tax=Streptomyces sp. NPDC050704 TaxID=3157219 RepID=UPI0034251AA4